MSVDRRAFLEGLAALLASAQMGATAPVLAQAADALDAVVQDNWKRLDLCWDGDVVRGYLDGVEVADLARLPFTVGAHRPRSGCVSAWFKGRQDGPQITLDLSVGTRDDRA